MGKGANETLFTRTFGGFDFTKRELFVKIGTKERVEKVWNPQQTPNKSAIANLPFAMINRGCRLLVAIKQAQKTANNVSSAEYVSRLERTSPMMIGPPEVQFQTEKR